jgi:hypothetical protein
MVHVDSDWTPTEQALPPSRLEVQTMDSGGHVQTLVRDGHLWWFPDRSMYVYYVPRFWKRLESGATS